MLLLKRAVLLIILSIFPLSFANSASFDCSKMKTILEKKICKNDYLSELDGAMARVFTSGLKNSANKTEIKLGQREWLKKRNSKNDNVLIEQYEKRILDLIKAHNYQPLLGKDSTEDLIISFIISESTNLKPESSENRMQTKSNRSVVAFVTTSGNRESEYKFYSYLDGKFQNLEIPTFDIESKTLKTKTTISGIVSFKSDIIEIFSGSGNHGGNIYTYLLNNSKLTLIRQESVTSSENGKEVTVLEYNK